MGKKVKTRSVTFRMSFNLAMLIVFLMFAVGFANYYSTMTSINNQILDKGWSIVRSSISFATDHMQSGNPDLLRDHMQHVMANGDVSYAAIINASGKIVAHTDQNQIGKTVPSTALPTLSTVSVYANGAGKPAGKDFVAPIVTKGGGILGYYRLGLGTARFDAILMDNLMNMIFITLASVMAGLMLAKVMAGRILKKPIEDLKEATEHIATGDFAHRVPVRQLDELGSLASAFNTMAVHLANLFMSVRTSAAELTKSSQVILNRSEEFRQVAENSFWDQQSGKSSPAGSDTSFRKQMEAIQEITLSAKKMSRLVDRLNALSLQFKL